MEKTLFIAALLALFGTSLFGQDTVLLTKNFRFADGIYFNLAELKANRPGLPIDSMKLDIITNPQTSLTQLNAVFLKKNTPMFSVDSIWAICLDGVPSIRVPKEEISKSLPNYAALKLRGKICYFTYPDYRQKTIRVAAYNPVTGRPFRHGNVLRDEEVIVEKMLHFETGEVADFQVEKLLTWIKDDSLLVETIAELPKGELKDKLFKSLLIYVDRNPTYLMVKDE
ncbi:MAG: hypothetical protein K9J37_08970 [Saprospiraceae bacterium]|nr:hypothetical protein [Saprospiraceae bacterium]MCF8250033.1 hypothetical protein [Saprospiraceae bacterium]MCF8278927.1 hypothetical protein [Bacteroidales bacterium]MCF8311046.1 hypothetical protein [Saprospiraceae bacterium]MCF8439618.1 hypothetical protein [Saprospiraceae bacterium]